VGLLGKYEREKEVKGVTPESVTLTREEKAQNEEWDPGEEEGGKFLSSKVTRLGRGEEKGGGGSHC